MEFTDPETGYSVFRLLLVASSMLVCRALFKRPSARRALSLVLLLNVVAWAAYVAPLARPYGLHTNRDRIFNLGNAAIVANGWSPLDQVQVGFTNLEPFWSTIGALMAGFRPENVLGTYGLLSPLVILAVGLGLYRGLRESASESDRWERVFIVFAVLGLASSSLSGQNPLRPHWVAMFLFKPNHAFAWALMGLAIACRASWVRLGLVLSLLSWVYIVYWAFFLPSLLIGAILLPAAQRQLRNLVIGVSISVFAAIPYVLHLSRDFNPVASDKSAAHMWKDGLGSAIALPHWISLDLGILGVVAVLGALSIRSSLTPRTSHLLGFGAVAVGLTLAYTIAASRAGLPAPDEQHYHYRFALALLAGRALAVAAGRIEKWAGWQTGQGAAVILGLFIPLSFHAYWDPPGMDDYFRYDRIPITEKTRAYGDFVRTQTPPDAIFLAGQEASNWIPVLSGRRVLLAGVSLRPADLPERKMVEREILFSRNPDRVRKAADRYGITHVAIDTAFLTDYGEERFQGISKAPEFELVFANSEVRILRIRK
jgi:hypothetical protein